MFLKKIIDINLKWLCFLVDKLTDISVFFIRTPIIALCVDIIIQILLFFIFYIFSYIVLILYIMFVIYTKRYKYIYKTFSFFRFNIFIIILYYFINKYVLLLFPITLIYKLIKSKKHIKYNNLQSFLMNISKFIKTFRLLSRKRIKYVVAMLKHLK